MTLGISCGDMGLIRKFCKYMTHRAAAGDTVDVPRWVVRLVSSLENWVVCLKVCLMTSGDIHPNCRRRCCFWQFDEYHWFGSSDSGPDRWQGYLMHIVVRVGYRHHGCRSCHALINELVYGRATIAVLKRDLVGYPEWIVTKLVKSW